MEYINNNETPTVSVIITFYNLGKYAKNCMNSLIQQNFKDCEFICVDDGSTDNTLEVLNEYKNKDNRVKVYHKENGGLSDARNFGIICAKGEYLSFIDGDDFVHPNYIEQLVLASELKKDRIVISPLKVIKYEESMDIKDGWSDEISFYDANQKTIFEKILYDELSVSACAKLFPKEAFEELRFPLGKVSEEVATIGDLVLKYDKFVVIKQPLYAYIMRNNSIGHKKKVDYKEITDRIEAMEILQSTVKRKYDINPDAEIGKALQYRWGLRYVSMAEYFDNTVDNVAAAKQMKMEVHNWFKNNIAMIMKNKRPPVSQRIRMLLYTYLPNIYLYIFDIYKKAKYNI